MVVSKIKIVLLETHNLGNMLFLKCYTNFKEPGKEIVFSRRLWTSILYGEKWADKKVFHASFIKSELLLLYDVAVLMLLQIWSDLT